MPTVWIGKTLDHYRITEKIGQGGSGEVFRGVDLSLDRPVAIKILRPDLASDPSLAERFRAEAQTLARLNHPHVATLYRLLWDRDLQVMIMEFVEGETLDALVRHHGPLPPELALPLFFQALEGIHHAHALGIVHRDIKASNVMLSRSGLVKVMDFGIARALGSNGLTQEGRPVGTPEYMSPEQIRGEDTDARSDIYSLGVLLFKLLSGRVPFCATSQYDVMRAHIEQPPPSLREGVPGLDAALEAVVARALAKSPADRFASVPELRRALSQASSGIEPAQPETLLALLEASSAGAGEEAGPLDGDTTAVPALAAEEPDCSALEDPAPTRVVPENDPRRWGARLGRAAAALGAALAVATLAVAALGPWGKDRERSSVDSAPLRLSAHGPDPWEALLPEPPLASFPDDVGSPPGTDRASARPEPAARPSSPVKSVPKARPPRSQRAARKAPERSSLPAAMPEEGAEGGWVIRR